MSRRILLINGHPDPSPARFVAALANAYEEAATAAGHAVTRIDVGALDVPLIRTPEEFKADATAPDIVEAQNAVRQAEHLVFVYPLWLGSQPAVLKAFLEQVFRYGFAISESHGGFPAKLLKGRTGRLMVTMGMPGFAYRFMFGAHGVRALQHSVLGLSGIAPVKLSLLGMMEKPEARAHHLETARALGRKDA